MSSFTTSILDRIPVWFDWALVPAAIALLALALYRKTRALAATGFLVAAGLSGVLLSLLVGTSVFNLFGYGRAVLNLLLNFGPGVTRDYIVTLIHANAGRLYAVGPMFATALCSGIAAAYLRRERPSPE